MFRTTVFRKPCLVVALLALASLAPAVQAAGTDNDQLAAMQQKLDQSIQMIKALAARSESRTFTSVVPFEIYTRENI